MAKKTKVKICPKCGAKNDGENTHCEKCGWLLDATMYADD